MPPPVLCWKKIRAPVYRLKSNRGKSQSSIQATVNIHLIAGQRIMIDY
jgi:hypothetical protein